MTQGQPQDDTSERLAILETHRLHDLETIHRLCQQLDRIEHRLEQQVSAAHSARPMTPEAATWIKLGVAMFLAAAMAALNAAGQTDLAAKVGRLVH